MAARSSVLETKAVASPAATLIVGYLTGVLIEVVPWLKDNLTADQQQSLPIILAFLAASVAGYYAPHTDRPDLAAELRGEHVPARLTTIDETRGGAGLPPSVPKLQGPPAAPPHGERM